MLSNARYLYEVPPDSTLAAINQLPDITDRIVRATIDARRPLRRDLALGATYWLDVFRIDDFALDPATLDRIAFPSALLLGSTYRPYTGNSASVRLIYVF